MGSKNRIAKHILPVMLEAAKVAGYDKWVEPFVGGGNMIDKVPQSFERIGYDLNPHTVAAMLDIRDNAMNLPESVTEQEYRNMKGLPEGSITSWVRIACAYAGIFESKLASGGFNKDGTPRNYASEAKRNAIKQQPLIQGVEFIHGCYKSVDVTGSLIYCDPPYKDTSGYKTGSFNHEDFFNWCREQSAKGNIVFVSEYKAPEDFKCVWQGEIKTNFASSRKTATHKAIEKLFRVG